MAPTLLYSSLVNLSKLILYPFVLIQLIGCSAIKSADEYFPVKSNCIALKSELDNTMKTASQLKKPLIGWREWVSLPALGVKEVKAKIDTGARTSSLHAIDLKFYKRNGAEYVKFKVLPMQKNTRKVIETHAKIIEHRNIRSSNGQISKRPIILTDIEILGQTWQIELALSNRDEMGFRMLLGRQSFRKKFLIDADNSFYGKKTKLK